MSAQEQTPPTDTDLRSVRLLSTEDIPEGFSVHTDTRRWNPLRHIPILNRYIFLEIIGPFLVALAFFTMIYMAVALQKMIGLFVGKGIDPWRLLDYLGYVLGNTLPNTVPMACLMSGIMASGRLSGDSEITAMRSAGVSFGRIYFNFLVFGFLTASLVAYLNFFLGPENTRKMNEFNNWIITYNPMLAVTPGQFSGDKTQDFLSEKGRTLYTEGLNRDTGQLSGIQIREWQISLEGNDYIRHNNTLIPMGGSRVTQIISAKYGHTIEKKNAKGEYEKSIRLKQGFIVEWNELKDGFSVTNFINGEMDYKVPTNKEKMVIGFNIKPETFSFPVLVKIRNSIQSESWSSIPGLEKLTEMGLDIKGIQGLKEMITKLKLEVFRGGSERSPAEMSNMISIYTQLQKLLKDSQKTLTAFNVEIHRRIAMPISCQIFFFLSFPLGLVARRSGKGMSFTLAIVFLFIYYAFFIFGSNISYKKGVPDWIGPWSANIVIAGISIYVMATRTDINLWETLPGRLLRKLISVVKFILRPFAFVWRYLRIPLLPLLRIFTLVKNQLRFSYIYVKRKRLQRKLRKKSTQ